MNSDVEQTPGNSAMTQLERQVERGSFFTHTAIGQNRVRLSEVESFTYGLIDTLVSKGIVSSEEISEATQNVRAQMEDDELGIGVAIRVDPAIETEQKTVEVDCSQRMHICKAVCCKLDFALTSTEIESGKVKWDLGTPYFIRHEVDGLCTHINRETGGCTVYADRPAICRGYSCARDKRIWKDFEKMELNQDWIDEHFVEVRPRALKVLMDHSAK